MLAKTGKNTIEIRAKSSYIVTFIAFLSQKLNETLRNEYGCCYGRIVIDV